MAENGQRQTSCNLVGEEGLGKHSKNERNGDSSGGGRQHAEQRAAAPISIMPSTPRFRVPDLSVINSPDAANNRGVEALMMLSTKLVM